MTSFNALAEACSKSKQSRHQACDRAPWSDHPTGDDETRTPAIEEKWSQYLIEHQLVVRGGRTHHVYPHHGEAGVAGVSHQHVELGRRFFPRLGYGGSLERPISSDAARLHKQAP